MPTSKPTAQTTIQTATERKAAEAQLRTIIDKHAADHLRLITAVRRRLRTLLPTAHEIVYEYRSWLVISLSPSERGYEGVLAIRADADGVKFYFNRGKELPDPDKLLKGSAQARWIELNSATTLSSPPVAALVEEAIARNRVPFASTGRGSVIIQQAAKKATKRSRSA